MYSQELERPSAALATESHRTRPKNPSLGAAGEHDHCARHCRGLPCPPIRLRVRHTGRKEFLRPGCWQVVARRWRADDGDSLRRLRYTGDPGAHRSAVRHLELATRFRPIHIGILFVAEAPPPRLENYFYYCVSDRSENDSQRTGSSGILFDSLLQGVGIPEPAGKGDEARLAEFQKRGLFLADLVECPREEAVNDEAHQPGQLGKIESLIQRFAPTLLKRIQFSYKPKYVALISRRLRHLIPIFQQAGLGDRLLLDRGLPLPFPHSAETRERFVASLTEVLSKAGARAKGA